MDKTIQQIVQIITDIQNGKDVKLPELKFGLDTATIIQTGIILAAVFGIPLWVIMFAFLEYIKNKRNQKNQRFN